MRARNFPSYRLRHAIRVWRYKRRHPWQFSQGEDLPPIVYDEGCAACASSEIAAPRSRRPSAGERRPRPGPPPIIV